MDVTLNIWGLAAVIIISMLIGYWAGRLGPERDSADEEESPSDMGRKARVNPENQGMKRIPLGWAIGSPVAGEVSFFYEGSKRGVTIRPEQEMLYSPAPGKITRLYPGGRALRLQTDYGVELLIQAGLGTDELEGRYFRPRVIRNEIVGKGKLLLEFDKKGIEDEGCDCSILMSVEDAENYSAISVTDAQKVKTGEDLIWVSR